MKLLNPSDAELNAAFAEKVAGWTRIGNGWQSMITHGCEPPLVDFRDANFTTSADAVLPWLEKHYVEFGKRYAHTEPIGWVIRVHGATFGQAEEDTFSKAAVLALLRAHGVEVEFTK